MDSAGLIVPSLDTGILQPSMPYDRPDTPHGARRGASVHHARGLRWDDLRLDLQRLARRTIFDPFRRGDTEAPGTGLGLAIVEGFVGLHGGRVWVEDRLGGGASFRVLLPGAGQGRAATARSELVVDRTRTD